MTRIVTWLAATLAVVALLFNYRTSTMGAPASAASRHRTTAPTGTASNLAADADQTVNGPTIDTRWGPVQVAVTVAGGKITDVQTLQAPSDNGRDQEITAYAVPVLHDEAIAAQSAQIDTVGGASYTSDGYRQSLQGALDQLTAATPAAAAPAATTSDAAPVPAPAAAPTPAAAPAPAATKPKPKPKSTTGTQRVDGPQIDTQWGPVQVSVSFRKGRIVDVKILQEPSDNGRDQEINSYAMPILVQETIAAQSAQIDAVGGASYTSDGYAQSLQGALDTAHFTG